MLTAQKVIKFREEKKKTRLPVLTFSYNFLSAYDFQTVPLNRKTMPGFCLWAVMLIDPLF